MRALAAAAVILLAACASNTAPVATISPTPRPSDSPSPSASPVASPTPIVQASSLGLSLNCKLPVTWTLPAPGNQLIPKAGFVSFPGATLDEDPNAPADSRFYDRAYNKWLPVFRTAVSPDGKRYAINKIKGDGFHNTGSTVTVVDVVSGATRVIYDGAMAFSVVDFETEGVYLTPAVPEGAPVGLWLQDLTGDQPRLISGSIIAPVVGGGSAWGIDFNAADPSPSPGGLEGPRNRLLRFDLLTGATTPLFYRPGANIWMLGVTANGLPLVTAVISDPAGHETVELWLIRSSSDAVRLITDTTGSLSPALAAVDSHGAWLDADYAGVIWLYTGGALQVVAKVNTKLTVSVAGGCIP